MGKAKAKGGAAAPPKCTCDDPFRCDCGNRPERPSRGHKWYPADQIWAGKGHKQKGASGQVSSVAEQAKVTATGKTQVAQWQLLPSQLLSDYCKRQVRPNPKFKAMSSTTSTNQHKYRVILCDPKDSEKDLFFVPSNSVANEEQAKEESALLALLQLTPTLPHERKLPEPYKTTWLNAIQHKNKQGKPTGNSTVVDTDGSKNSGSKSTSRATGTQSDGTTERATDISAATASSTLVLGTTFTSNASRRQKIEEKRQLQNARIRKHEAIRMANQNHPVFMSASMRKQIERLLLRDDDPKRSLMDVDSDDDDKELIDRGMEGDFATATTRTDDDSDAMVYVAHRLCKEGFTQRQARVSYREIVDKASKYKNVDENESMWEQLYEDCLQWLLVRLNEDQLPEGFDPRGRTLDVLVPTSLVATDSSKQSKTSVHAFDDNCVVFAEEYGISVDESVLIAALASKQDVLPVDVFCQTAARAASIPFSEQSCPSYLPATDGMIDIFNDEIEALSAIYDSACSVSSAGDDSSLVSVALDGGSLTLSVLVQRGLYPSIRPKRVVVHGKWPSKVGAFLHVQLAKLIEDIPLGEPLIFAIHNHAEELLQSSELTQLSLVPWFGDSKRPSSNSSATTASPAESPQNGKQLSCAIQRRPRESRKSFWTLHPRDTPPAIANPKVSLLLERTRKSLPAAGARSEFLDAIAKAEAQGTRVVLVTGETGSGKTTQLPAYMLENNPTGEKIVVVQPRRIAATGVANRVAQERGEKQVGVESVGYVVRGDSAISHRSRLVFCTTGVLLRQLQNKGSLDCLTTIIVDEVHERNLDGDVLLGLLKQLLPEYPKLRVVLMSATLETSRFANYWGSSAVPHLHIPGRTFPVHDFLLDDVLRITGYIPSKGHTKSKTGNRRNRSSPWNDSEKSDNEQDDEDVVDTHHNHEGPTPMVVPHTIPIDDLVKRVDETTPDVNLICRLVDFLIRSKDPNDDGSILVFLAGAPEINKATETIKRGLKDLSIAVLPLHGALQPREQQRVFQPAQRGFTKVVLSTNVAETSVTIPDCTVVIDSCREKQASFDPVNRMPQLLEQFASKAALKQRRGRAGRVREGKCYKLISRTTYELLRDHSEPEIRRVALDQTLLQLMFLGVERGSGTFMSTLLDPPSKVSMEAAIFSLMKLGAVESGQKDGELNLSPLGLHIAGIPAPPIVGKMLVMGSILGCREAALAMAAGISVGRSPLIRIDTPRISSHDNPTESIDQEKDQQILVRRSTFAKDAGNSDHALVAALFLKWMVTETTLKKDFCDSLGLSYSVLRDIKDLFKQLDASLIASGFSATPDSDRNQKSLRIIHTCAVSAMSPSQLVKVRRPATKYAETAEGARQKDGEAKEMKFFVRTENCVDDSSESSREERVFLHPSSTSFQTGNFSCPFLVYNSMVRTSKPFLRDVTECSAYSLLLFGGEMKVKAAKGIVVVDGWAELSANARIGSLMGGLRGRIDALLTEKIKTPTMDISSSDEMTLVVRLITTDGLGT